MYLSDKTSYINLRLSPVLDSRIKELARIFGVSKSLIIRYLLESALDVIDINRLRGRVTESSL